LVDSAYAERSPGRARIRTAVKNLLRMGAAFQLVK